jgi:hypothetical protein
MGWWKLRLRQAGPERLRRGDILDSAAIDNLSVEDRQRIAELVAGRPAKSHGGIHGWLVAAFPEGSPEYERYVKARDTWAREWSDDYGQERGFLDVRGEP